MMFYAEFYRGNRHNKKIIDEILTEYGDDVNINGPILYTEGFHNLNDGPETFVCDVSVDCKRIRRNVHEVEAFKAHVTISGTIDRHKLEVPIVYPDLIGNVPDSAAYKTNDILILTLDTDPRQVSALTPLTIGGKTVEWECAGSYFTAQVSITDMPEIIEYTTEFNVRGTGSIHINQAGRKSDISIEGTAESTSFVREHRPEEYAAGNGRFTARWSATRDFTVPSYIQTDYTCIDFPLGIGQYRMLSRSLKSAFVLFVMVLLFVLSTEAILRRDIRLMSYCMTACSLALFFILLLCLSELMIFGIAYLIASLLIIALIAVYLHRLTGSKITGIITACVLSTLFLCFYIMLCLSTFSFLMGALLLLVSVIITMFIIAVNSRV